MEDVTDILRGRPYVLVGAIAVVDLRHDAIDRDTADGVCIATRRAVEKAEEAKRPQPPRDVYLAGGPMDGATRAVADDVNEIKVSGLIAGAHHQVGFYRARMPRTLRWEWQGWRDEREEGPQADVARTLR